MTLESALETPHLEQVDPDALSHCHQPVAATTCSGVGFH
jgi:hypothetical protein